jgi:hypothetical protein
VSARVVGGAAVGTAMLAVALALPGCASAGTASMPAASQQSTEANPGQEASAMETIVITVNGRAFSATLADTEAARQFAARLPMTLDMSELNGNEKYAFGDATYSIEGASVASPIEAGDLMLYEDDCVVLFYETHDNALYSYVPLAKIDDPSGLGEVVGSGSAAVAFSVAK